MNLKEYYKHIIEEINDELEEGLITQQDTIQILRADKPMIQDYCVIQDWYYDAYTMKQELDTPVEEMYMEDEFTKAEWVELKKAHLEYKQQYLDDQSKLTQAIVKDVLTEMKQIIKICK